MSLLVFIACAECASLALQLIRLLVERPHQLRRWRHDIVRTAVDEGIALAARTGKSQTLLTDHDLARIAVDHAREQCAHAGVTVGDAELRKLVAIRSPVKLVRESI